MEPDRALQQRILEALRDAHPRGLNMPDFADFDAGALGVTAKYLADHDLISGSFRVTRDRVVMANLRITQHGLDRLAADGGLSAQLNVVTVRLHEDSIKELIAAWIAEAQPDQTVRRRWLAALRSLPAETTKRLALRLLELGLRHAPDALHTIETWLYR